jgi:hypothetical protein
MMMGWATLLGFAVAWALLGMTYSNVLIKMIVSPLVPLLLCPPSIASMALENASRNEILSTWLLIACLNAALYGVAGVSLSFLWKSD